MIRLASQYALIETRRDTALDLQRIEQSSRGRVSIVVRDWAEQSGERTFGWRQSERPAVFGTR